MLTYRTTYWRQSDLYRTTYDLQTYRRQGLRLLVASSLRRFQAAHPRSNVCALGRTSVVMNRTTSQVAVAVEIVGYTDVPHYDQARVTRLIKECSAREEECPQPIYESRQHIVGKLLDSPE